MMIIAILMQKFPRLCLHDGAIHNGNTLTNYKRPLKKYKMVYFKN